MGGGGEGAGLPLFLGFFEKYLSTTIFQYPSILLGGERHCENASLEILWSTFLQRIGHNHGEFVDLNIFLYTHSWRVK